MKEYSVSLTGNLAQDLYFFSSIGVDAHNKEVEDLLKKLYSVPVDLRRVILSDEQIKQFKDAKSRGDDRIRPFSIHPVKDFVVVDFSSLPKKEKRNQGWTLGETLLRTDVFGAPVRMEAEATDTTRAGDFVVMEDTTTAPMILETLLRRRRF